MEVAAFFGTFPSRAFNAAAQQLRTERPAQGYFIRNRRAGRVRSSELCGWIRLSKV